jgi:drug/metabolite transporter (DMT)-like permease
MKNNDTKYILLILFISLVWGFGFIASKQLIDAQMPVFLMMFIRFAVGGALLFVLARILKMPKITRAELKYGILIGFVMFVAFALQTIGQKYTTPAKSGLLTVLYVVLVPIITMCLKRKFRPIPVGLALISFFGVAVVSDVFGAEFSLNLGDFLMILCAVSFAIQFILVEKFASRFNVLNFAVVQLLATAVFSGVSTLIFEGGQYGGVLWNKTIFNLFFLGVFSSALCYYLQNFVQTKVSAARLAVVGCSESVFTLIFSLALGYDILSPSLIIGSVIITAAVVLAAVLKQDKIL